MISEETLLHELEICKEKKIELWLLCKKYCWTTNLTNEYHELLGYIQALEFVLEIKTEEAKQ